MRLLRAALLFLLLVTVVRAADESYAGDTPRAGNQVWHYILILHTNGNAVFRTIKSRRDGVLECGQWWKTPEGNIALQYLDRDKQPRGGPLTWTLHDGVLTPLTWDKAEWGDLRPPVLQQE